MTEESMFMDIIKMPLLAITILIITFIGIYFEIPLMIPPFAATLFMVYLREGDEFAHFKNVLGGHLIAFACAFIEPFLGGYFTSIPDNFSKAVIIGIAVLLAGWLMAITRLEHPPAIATTLVFFNIGGEGYLVLNVVPIQALISFLVGLGIVSTIAFFMYRRS